MPWRNEITAMGDQLDERITKGTVKGLRARIALVQRRLFFKTRWYNQKSGNYKSYYQIARDETNDIITSGQHSFRSKL